MDFKQQFEIGLAWRTAILVVAIWLLNQALDTRGLVAARLLATIIGGFAVASLWQFIRRTNVQVARFIDSVRFEDYSQCFSAPSGGGFGMLGEQLDRALKMLRSRHEEASVEARYLSAIVDDAPIALLAVSGGRIQKLNKAARQLFARHELTRREHLAALGPELMAAVELPSGTRKITRLMIDGMPQRAIFTSAQLTRLGGDETILAILPVQSELGAFEAAAQADLVRVLTHEIMNSLTPVTSLARSSADLVAAAEATGLRLAEARVATETVARRAEGLLRFVESYREFSRSPEVTRRLCAAKPWAEDVLRLALASAGAGPVAATLEVSPPSLKLNADPELLAQAVLNMLRNALRATQGVEQPAVHFSVNRQPGGSCQISVLDNGPGIPAERREDVFLPFYTTQKGGSGVGLSFARQVVLAHGGTIHAEEGPEGGASLIIIL